MNIGIFRFRWIVLLICSVLSMFACKTHKADPVANEVVENSSDTLLVSLKRGACFGACPQFDCVIYKSGYAVYDGERNVSKTGRWHALLSREQVTALRSLIGTCRMEEMDTVYINKYLADYPAFFVAVSDKKPTKRIYVNHDQPPVEITSFVTNLERMLESLEWKKEQGGKMNE